MEKEFIPNEQALALKALGFDEPCFMYYSNGELVFSGHVNNAMQRFRYSIPLYQQAFRWFRDNHNLYHRIDPSDIKDISYSIFDEDGEICEDSCYWSYEQAELKCLIKLIEIVESKKS